MNSGRRRVMILRSDPHGLISSYARALEGLDHEVVYWDHQQHIESRVRFGRVGRVINTFWPVEAWITKANRDLVVAARRAAPDVLIVAGREWVLAGALAQIKCAVPGLRTVLLWPDMLQNLSPHVLHSLPLYDLIATYSSASTPWLKALGGSNVEWFPFAVDTFMHTRDVPCSEAERHEFACDVAFVGNHRPEREAAVHALLQAGISVKVWGEADWKRRASVPSRVPEYWQGRALYGADFSRAVRCAKVSLNVVDDTNYPAANMRFFEVLGAGGLAINSPCPEVEGIFRDGVECFYFKSTEDLVRVTRELIDARDLRERVSAAGYEKAMQAHTYSHRAAQLLEHLARG